MPCGSRETGSFVSVAEVTPEFNPGERLVTATGFLVTTVSGDINIWHGGNQSY